MRLRPHDAKVRRPVQLEDGRQALVWYVPPRYGMRVKLRLPDGTFISRHMEDLQPLDESEAS